MIVQVQHLPPAFPLCSLRYPICMDFQTLASAFHTRLDIHLLCESCILLRQICMLFLSA